MSGFCIALCKLYVLRNAPHLVTVAACVCMSGDAILTLFVNAQQGALKIKVAVK